MEEKTPLNNFGDKLSQGRNQNTFSSTNQPATQGRKKTSDILKIMRAMGKTIVPESLINDTKITAFLEAEGKKRTFDAVCIARLYLIAIQGKDSVAIKAIKQVFDIQNGKKAGSKHGVVINFVTPPVQEETIELKSDSWSSVQVPGESAP